LAGISGKQLPAHPEHGLPQLFELQIGFHFVEVEVVFLQAYFFRVVTVVPGIDRQLSGVGQRLHVGDLFADARDRFGPDFHQQIEGRLQGIYRKTHETKSTLESMRYDAGDDLPVFDTPWGVVGVLICHDRW